MIEFLLDPTVFSIFGFLLGAVLGSFLNVCAHRIPIAKSVVKPASHCPDCGTDIPWYRNLPVLTWIFQEEEPIVVLSVFQFDIGWSKYWSVWFLHTSLSTIPRT